MSGCSLNPADRDAQLRGGGQKDVHARAELHQPHALARCQLRPGLHTADDPAGEDADELPEHNRLPVVLNPDFAVLVGHRGVAMVRRQKSAALEVDAQHAAGNRRAVHVHVHRGEKDADLAPIARGRGGRIGRARHQHAAVGRRQHRDVGVGRRVSIGIAKEEREEAGENHKWHGAGVANGQSRCHRKGGRATDEGKTCPIDPHPAILARVNA